jgi:hypothetical protein
MKFLKPAIVVALTLFLGACARDNAVAMNLYDPATQDYEVASGVSVEITQDMIDNYKKKAK